MQRRTGTLFPQPLRFLAIKQMLDYVAHHMNARYEIEVAQRFSRDYSERTSEEENFHYEHRDIYGEVYTLATGALTFIIRKSEENETQKTWSSLEFDTASYSSYSDIPEHRRKGIETALQFSGEYLSSRAFHEQEETLDAQ